MKKIVILIFLSILSFAGFSQVQRRANSDSIKKTDQLNPNKKARFAEAGLTKPQIEKLQNIKEENKTEKEKVEKDASLSNEEKEKKLVTLKAEYKQAVAEVLTPEQQAKLKAIKEAQKSTKQ